LPFSDSGDGTAVSKRDSHATDAARTPAETAFVLCPCKHGLERHGADGCRGDRANRCSCRLTQSEALDAAVEGVRLTYTHPRPGATERDPSA
jgi:hypothetical protein